jgi:hypothetical protein
VVVVTHSAALVEALSDAVEVPDLRLVELTKDLGETLVVGQGMLSTPSWEWGRR